MSINRQEITAVARGAKERWQAPALSVAVAGAGEAIWSESFGIADIDHNTPATADTVYRMASITKPITATAVMQLVEQEKISLDAPVQKYVSDFPQKSGAITVRHLLAHLSGIRDFDDAEGRNQTHYPYGSVPLTTFLDRFQDSPLLHEPGSKFRYSTHGYNLLGCVIEQVSGTDYASYIRTHILAPAGMTRTFVDDVHADIAHRAKGYVLDEENERWRDADVVDTSDHLPGGGLCATVEDVARFGVSLLAGRLLRPETLTQIFTPQRTKTGQNTRFGLGWFVWQRNGETHVAHGGKHYGTSTMLLMKPQSGVVVALMTNLQGVPAPAMIDVAQKLAGRIVGNTGEKER